MHSWKKECRFLIKRNKPKISYKSFLIEEIFFLFMLIYSILVGSGLDKNIDDLSMILMG